MQLTDSQKSAVYARDPFIIVSAAAGSGKTRVLTERIIQHLCDPENPYDISRLLVVTFTRAAASEMRSRIARSLLDRIAEGGADADYLRMQLARLGSAHIQTVHSFCSDFLKKNFSLTSLTPDFAICDGTEKDAISQECVSRVLDEAYDANPEGFALLRTSVCPERSDGQLEDTILKMYARLQSHIDPRGWIEAQKNDADLPTFGTAWGKLIMETAKSLARSAVRSFKEGLAAASAPVREKNAKIIAAYSALCDAYADTDSFETPADFAPALSALKEAKLHARLNSKCDDADSFALFKSGKEVCDIFLNGREKKHGLSEIVAAYMNGADAFENKQASSAMKCFCDLLLRFDELYCAEKRRKRLADYSDLEHFTLRILTDHPEIAGEMRENLQELLVDEYQDTNEVQDKLFSLIAPKHGSSFFVGDIKQSIYKFRLADPEIFIRHYKSASPTGENGKRRIDMSQNFRSRPEVLDLCNHIFEKTMSEKLGDIDYDDSQRLYAGRPADDPQRPLPSELCIIDAKGVRSSPYTADEAEAKYTARRIRELLMSETVPAGDTLSRPALPEDFAILLSSLKDKAEIFRRALTEEGIPCSVETQKDFISCVEGSVIYSLLKVIDNPVQDIPLLSVMYSPLFSFTPDDLANIRAECKDGSLWQAVCASAQKNDKCRSFTEKLSQYRKTAKLLTASRLLQYIYSDTGAYGIFSALPAAESRRQTLDLFYDLALRRENGAFLSCYDFVCYLENSSKTDNKPTFKAGGGVRIMSIHKSKGLEFPFVFVCLLGKTFNLQDAQKEPLLIDKDLGLALKYIDKKRRIKLLSGKSLAVREKMIAEQKSEEIRKLYVAFTRARERLFLVMSLEKTDNIASFYDAALPRPDPDWLMTQSSAAPWILSALMDHPDAGPLISRTRDAGRSAQVPEHKLSITFENLFEILDRAGTPVETAPEALAPSETFDEYISLAGKDYPYSHISALPSKMTPTALSEHTSPVRQAGESQKSAAPSEHADPRQDALRRGTAFHLFLSAADFTKCGTIEGIREETARLSVTSPDISLADEKALFGFFSSELGKRAKASAELYREYQFGVLLTPSQIGLADIEDERILVNGSVDLMFFEEKGIVIVDFKTDSIKPGTESAAAEKHRAQLTLYEKAAQEIFGLPVTEKTVFFLKTGGFASL